MSRAMSHCLLVVSLAGTFSLVLPPAWATDTQSRLGALNGNFEDTISPTRGWQFDRSGDDAGQLTGTLRAGGFLPASSDSSHAGPYATVFEGEYSAALYSGFGNTHNQTWVRLQSAAVSKPTEATTLSFSILAGGAPAHEVLDAPVATATIFSMPQAVSIGSVSFRLPDGIMSVSDASFSWQAKCDYQATPNDITSTSGFILFNWITCSVELDPKIASIAIEFKAADCAFGAHGSIMVLDSIGFSQKNGTPHKNPQFVATVAPAVTRPRFEFAVDKWEKSDQFFHGDWRAEFAHLTDMVTARIDIETAKTTFAKQGIELNRKEILSFPDHDLLELSRQGELAEIWWNLSEKKHRHAIDKVIWGTAEPTPNQIYGERNPGKVHAMSAWLEFSKQEPSLRREMVRRLGEKLLPLFDEERFKEYWWIHGRSANPDVFFTTIFSLMPQTRLRLAGRASHEGNEARNRYLANQRAATIKAFLIARHVPDKVILDEGNVVWSSNVYDEDQQATENSRGLNRSVIVEIVEPRRESYGFFGDYFEPTPNPPASH